MPYCSVSAMLRTASMGATTRPGGAILQVGDAQRPGPGYVPAIDGLRAVAIAAVLLFHLRPGLLPGGLAGVDLFFVISGFVVTGSLLRRPAEPLAALATGFFARRIVRIVPALVVMLLAVSLASVLFIPMAAEMTMVRGTAVSAAMGASNIFLAIWDDAYLARNTGLNPLLHSWTLGVEEQFYLVFPLLFHLRRDGSDRVVAAVAVASGLSLLTCLLLSWRFPTLVFYMMPTRFWELGAGVLLRLAFDRCKRPALPGWAALAGAALCGAALLFCFRRPLGDFPMPGALPVVIASLGLIAIVCLRPAGLVAMALSIPPALYVGRISYGLYLWHWPVFVLFGWTIGLEGWANVLAALALSFVLAAASWHLVEQPLRRAVRAGRISDRAILAIGIGALLACAAVTTLLFRAEPVLALSRHDQPNVYVAAPDPVGCLSTLEQGRIGGGTRLSWTPHCPAPHASGTLFIVGDSHANRWSEAMPRFVAETGATATVLTHPNCDFPALSAPMARKPTCRAFYAAATRYLLRTLKPADVLFLPSLRFPGRAMDEEGLAVNVAPPRPGTEAEYVALSRRLAATGARLVIEAPIPIFGSPAFRCTDWFNRDNPVCRAGLTVDRARIEAMRGPVLARMRRLAVTVPGMEIWDPMPILCPGTQCSALRDGRPLYIDTNHLNYRGHMLLYPSLRAVLGPRREVGR